MNVKLNGSISVTFTTAASSLFFLIMSQYAISGEGKTIHSKTQLEHFGMIVHDSSRRTGGRQCIVTNEGYVLPLHENDPDAVEIGSWGDTPLVQPTVIFVKPVQNGT
jgi:hypothetical protein